MVVRIVPRLTSALQRRVDARLNGPATKPKSSAAAEAVPRSAVRKGIKRVRGKGWAVETGLAHQ
jgi:hypothetical protein